MEVRQPVPRGRRAWRATRSVNIIIVVHESRVKHVSLVCCGPRHVGVDSFSVSFSCLLVLVSRFVPWRLTHAVRRGIGDSGRGEEAGETGAQGSDAVPQVYQGSSQIGDRSKGKGCHQARGFAEGRDGSDAAAVAETTGDFGAMPPRSLAEVDCEGSVSHVSSSASCSAPLSPQQWALGLAASLPEDVRVKFEEWYSSVEIEAKASVDPYSEVLSQGSLATLLPANPVSSTPVAATSTGSAFRAAKAPVPSQRATPHAAGFLISKSQERPPVADQFVIAAAQPLPGADV